MTAKKYLYLYEGKEVDVQWDQRLCIHVGECGRAEGDLFVAGRKPWCQPDVAQQDDVHGVVERCPTGALTVKEKDGSEVGKAAPDNKVVIANDGPLYFEGDLDIAGAADDMGAVRYRAALCRCGASKNKPFCDNSHRDAGFRDSGAVGQTGDGRKGPGGTLKVNKAKDGPLLLAGNFKIVTASGRVAFEGDKAALCRCGQSKNKPFCDGAHKAAGFSAD